MQYTTGSLLRATLRVLPVRIHLRVIVTFSALALLGHPLEVSAGWLVWPPVVYLAPSPSRSCPLARPCPLWFNDRAHGEVA